MAVYGLVVLLYTNITEKCLLGNSKKFVFGGCRGGGGVIFLWYSILTCGCTHRKLKLCQFGSSYGLVVLT